MIVDKRLLINQKERVGQKFTANNGQTMTVTAYRGTRDVDVEFEDGTEILGIQYSHVQHGKVRNPNFSRYSSLIGSSFKANNGQMMTIIGVKNSRNVSVRFEDNTVVDNIQLCHVKSGYVKNPNTIKVGDKLVNRRGQLIEVIRVQDSKIKITIDGVKKRDWLPSYKFNTNLIYKGTNGNRVGEKRIAYNGIEMEIVNYESPRNIRVKFDDGVESTTEYSVFEKSGKVRQILRGSKIYDFTVEKFVYRLEDEPSEVNYICNCSKCGYRDILTPREMKLHNCEE